MLNIYWLCFAIGGVFVLLSVLGGLDGVDFGDYDADLDIDEDVELVDAGDRPKQSFIRQRHPWYLFLGILKSLKFWTFGLCFFGLTGLVLSNLSVTLAPLVVVVLSVFVGLGCGALVSGTLQILRQQKADSLVRSDDLIGLTGTVELPFDKDSRGKVRLLVKGNVIDSIAYTDDTQPFKLGDRILVVSAEQNRLWVVSASHLNEGDIELRTRS